MLTLSEIGRSRYLLYRGLCDAGFPAGNVSLAVDILLGPEPREDEPDWDEYERWARRQDALEAAHPPVREADVRAAGLAI